MKIRAGIGYNRIKALLSFSELRFVSSCLSLSWRQAKVIKLDITLRTGKINRSTGGLTICLLYQNTRTRRKIRNKYDTLRTLMLFLIKHHNEKRFLGSCDRAS